MSAAPCLEPGCPLHVSTARKKGAVYTYGWCIKHYLLATMTVELKTSLARHWSAEQNGREWVVHRPTQFSEYYLREKEFNVTLYEASPRDALPEDEPLTIVFSTKP